MLVDAEVLKQHVKCRDQQIDTLNSLLWDNAELCPSSILLHGAPATGKSTVLTELLKSVPHSIVACDQCVSTKMLLQRVFRKIHPNSSVNLSSDNYSVFFSALELERASEDKLHVLVLDRIDQFPDPTELLNCFSRHTELASTNFVVIFTVSSLQPRSLVTTSIPMVHFPRYTRQEAVVVIQSLQLCQLEGDSSFWNNFCDLVVHGLDSYTGSDIRLIKDVALKLWPEYIKPVVEGRLGSHEHQKLYKEAQSLFTGEWAVSNTLVQSKTVSHDLPERCKFILCAAYLASYNPAKTDVRFFSKAKDLRITKRQVKNEANGKTLGLVNRRSLTAPPFEMERMLAILHAIDEHAQSTITLQNYIATLSTLRLLIRTNSIDPLSLKARWRINVGWSMIQKIAHDVQFEIKDHLYE